MKLLFLCASLEPGRDGVGDYTARLAAELRSRGHHCLSAAIDDSHLQGDAGENGLLRGAEFFRLSRKKSWSERMEILRKEASEFRPDWVSLQFVAHGFHPKGLPLLLPSRLASIGGAFDWQIMFHEIWIEPRGRWSNHIISKLQKFLLGEICRKLLPKVVHTSNPYYAARLESAGIRCGELPLFGNIPVVQRECSRCADEWVFVFFGSLRRGWDPEPLLSKIESARAASGKAICRFVSIGRLGMVGELLWDRMENAGYRNFFFQKHGELAPPEISHALQSADFGIAVSPLHLLGKSGAVAAMQEHGLPVIVNRLHSKKIKEDLAIQSQEGSRNQTDPVLTSRAFIKNRLNAATILLDDNFELNLISSKRDACKESLPEVADQFLKDLKKIS